MPVGRELITLRHLKPHHKQPLFAGVAVQHGELCSGWESGGGRPPIDLLGCDDLMPVPFSGLSRGNSTRECDQAAYEDWQCMLHNKPPLETRGGHLSEWSGPTQGLNIRACYDLSQSS